MPILWACLAILIAMASRISYSAFGEIIDGVKANRAINHDPDAYRAYTLRLGLLDIIVLYEDLRLLVGCCIRFCITCSKSSQPALSRSAKDPALLL